MFMLATVCTKTIVFIWEKCRVLPITLKHVMIYNYHDLGANNNIKSQT